MEKENIQMKKKMFIKGFLKITKHMDMVVYHVEMDIYIKDIGKIIFLMDMASVSCKISLFLKVNLKTE